MDANVSALDELRTHIAALEQLGSETRPIAAIPPDEITGEIEDILRHRSFPLLPAGERGAVLFRIHLIYSGTWHASGQRIISLVETACADLFADDDAPLSVLCVGYDLLYFLYWCWTPSLDDQVALGRNVIAPFVTAVRRRTKLAAKNAKRSHGAGLLSGRHKRRVGYLAEFVSSGPGNAIAVANRVVLDSLARAFTDKPPTLYAWLFHDPETLASYAAKGVRVRAVSGSSTEERITSLQQMIAEDRPDVLITDMNAALPAVLFSRRVAPIQIFYQFGMPVWPVPEVDAVFHVWDFDFRKAGLTGRPHWELIIPYDVASFAQPIDRRTLELERARLGVPEGRLIGTYGRLAKITRPFIETVSAACAGHPDVTVLLGGSGDASSIRETLAALGLADRFVVVDSYVDGHVWGHLLDVFLDTFPQPGGASCLEVIAKGKPVVALSTRDSANLARRQRVASLVADDPACYEQIVRRLLGDQPFYQSACEETRRLAASFPNESSYAVELADAIRALRRRSRWGWLRFRRLGRALQRP